MHFPNAATGCPDHQGSLTEALGDRTREADYRAFFIGETRRLGIDAVIRTYLPAMVNGLAGSATHPLMRLAYGVLKKDDQEVGTALGYWAACYLPLPSATGAAPDTDDPGKILADVGTIEGIRDYEPETDLLWHNIRAVAALPGFRPVIDRLAFNADTPRRMAETSLALFAGTMDFSALHSLTGMHWLRLVSPHLENAEPFYRAFWQVIASLVPKIGFPAPPPPRRWKKCAFDRRPPDGDQARRDCFGRRTRCQPGFSALQEEEVWKDPLYRVVAARRVGLIA